MCAAPTPLQYARRAVVGCMLLLVAPHKLASVALRFDVGSAVILGGVAAALGAGLLLSAQAAPAGEPFMSLSDYLAGYLVVGAVLGVACFLVAVPVLALCASLGYASSSRILARPRACVVALTPWALLPAWTFWCAIVALHNVDRGDFVRSSPAWVDSPALAIPAHPLWGFTLGAAGVVACLHGLREVHRLVKARSRACRACGYDLTGLTTRICPECGKRSAA